MKRTRSPLALDERERPLVDLYEIGDARYAMALVRKHVQFSANALSPQRRRHAPALFNRYDRIVGAADDKQRTLDRRDVIDRRDRREKRPILFQRSVHTFAVGASFGCGLL